MLPYRDISVCIARLSWLACQQNLSATPLCPFGNLRVSDMEKVCRLVVRKILTLKYEQPSLKNLGCTTLIPQDLKPMKHDASRQHVSTNSRHCNVHVLQEGRYHCSQKDVRHASMIASRPLKSTKTDCLGEHLKM